MEMADQITSLQYITYTLAPNGPEKWGCRIRDLFSKIRDLFSKFETYAVIRDYETKKTAGAAEPPEPPSLAPMSIIIILTYLNNSISDEDIARVKCTCKYL